MKFRLGSAGEPTISSHCNDVLNEDDRFQPKGHHNLGWRLVAIFLAKVAKGFRKALAKFSELSKLSRFDCQEPEIIIFFLANLAKTYLKVLAKSHKS